MIVEIVRDERLETIQRSLEVLHSKRQASNFYNRLKLTNVLSTQPWDTFWSLAKSDTVENKNQ